MIDTKALRSRVLDLAIRGQLTEQLESDGTAFDNNGHIKTYSDSNPFHIPDNWKWTTISDVISKDIGGGTPSKTVKEYWEGGTIPWMSVKDFSSVKNGVLYDTKDHITESGLQNSTSNLIDTDAIIICVRMGLGRIVKLCKPTAINQDLRAIWLSDCIDGDYFIYFYSTLRVEGHGMTVSGINKKELMGFKLPLPPLAEQKRIVARVEEIFRILDTIDEAQQKYTADVESLKAKLITAGIQGKLTEQLESDGTAEELYQQIQAEKQKLIKEGKIKKEKPLPPIKPEEVPFEIPSSWKWVRLKSLGQFSSGKTPSMAESAFWDGSIAWVSSKDMKKTVITDSEMHVTELAAKDMKIYPAGTLLLVARSGILRHSLPLCVLGVESTINQDIKAFSLYDTSLSKWVYFALKGFESYIIRELVKAMTTVESLKFEEFSNMLIPLPPLAEQKRIADKLDELLIAMQ